MITSIIGWVLFGLVAGAVARMLHPGNDAMGWLGTIVLGDRRLAARRRRRLPAPPGREPLRAGRMDHVGHRGDRPAGHGVLRHADPGRPLTVGERTHGSRSSRLRVTHQCDGAGLAPTWCVFS